MTDESPVPAEGAEQPPTPQPVDETPANAVPAAAGAPRARWQDRVLRLPAVIGVALATLIMGGFGGAALGALTHDRDHHDGWGDRHERMGGWGPGRRGDGPMGPGHPGPGGYGYGPGPNQNGPNQSGTFGSNG